MLPDELHSVIARELSLSPRQVAGALALFDAGNTLPFIARYRKEATGGLDEVQLRDVRDRATYLTELAERRDAVIKSIDEQGKLTSELRAQIEGAGTKQALEDLYLPFKPKRRTRATIARDRGLEPLAELVWQGAAGDAEVESAAAAFVSAEREVPDVAAALQGARDILAERVSEDAALRGWIRDRTRERGVLRASAAMGKEKEVSKFQDYYDFSEPLGAAASHRILAIRRGEAEGFLVWTIEAPAAEIVAQMERELVEGRAARGQMRLVVQDAYKRLLAPSIEIELRLELKTRADQEAIAIFGQNLEQLLLASPAGGRAVLGLDPGFRTGVKVAVVSRTGAVAATDTLYLHQSESFAAGVRRLVQQHRPELIAIGNGTASRETESAVRAALRELPAPQPQVVVVNEAGASVYSASELAREELPELDVSLRGAVSIARRLQDPLAELVKIDPKSIGVGQYQHDVNQPKLKKRLDEVVESCVNRVGVELNTASVALLSYVAGVGPTLAQNIVRLRDTQGGFKSRKDLTAVPRLGAKAFEQAAGFLRVRGGEHPLDASAVHPERYPLVERMAHDLGATVESLIGNDELLRRIEPQRYVTEDVGLPTLRDILDELRKPGRDPRATFELPAFREDITEPKDLKEGMVLEGVVTNIVAFGAFVDVGVHQDGLVHVSQLSDRFVRDPNDVVRVGQRVKVTVLSVDLERNRIALSMKSKPDAGGAGSRDARPQGARGEPRRDARGPQEPTRRAQRPAA
ncbi:MAG TPA: Tex family protein, partial [Gemmatimonadaceae bacterium]|nr:Tex family protein [Gemmatimonadaceae bacterium]